MATNQNMLQRQARVLERLDEGHKTLHASLEGLDPADAFLGSRWSVWEVLNHLDRFLIHISQPTRQERNSYAVFCSK